MSFLEFKDVTVKQRERVLLSDICASFSETGVYSVIGPSESGKSYLLKTINRLIDHEKNINFKGELIFQNRDILKNSIDVKILRESIGMIFHKPIAFPGTIFDNVSISLKIHNISKNITSIVKKGLEDVNLWDELKNSLHKKASNYSLEIQQRLALARVLTLQPKIILMDNPTVMMDPLGTSRFESWILSMKNRYLIIFVTSDIKQAARISDEILFMNDGSLIEQNSTESFFSHPKHLLTESYISEFHFI
ncbi:ATP-binding cassette domain-containing protein [bacterium]|nr:ATP-binding cassette domain-containing protein [bacterium]